MGPVGPPGNFSLCPPVAGGVYCVLNSFPRHASCLFGKLAGLEREHDAMRMKKTKTHDAVNSEVHAASAEWRMKECRRPAC